MTPGPGTEPTFVALKAGQSCDTWEGTCGPGAAAKPGGALSGKAFAGNALGPTVPVVGRCCDTWEGTCGPVALAGPTVAVAGKSWDGT